MQKKVLHIFNWHTRKKRQWSRGNIWKDSNWNFSKTHELYEYTHSKSQKKFKQDTEREIPPRHVSGNTDIQSKKKILETARESRSQHKGITMTYLRFSFFNKEWKYMTK